MSACACAGLAQQSSMKRMNDMVNGDGASGNTARASYGLERHPTIIILVLAKELLPDVLCCGVLPAGCRLG